MANLLLYGLPLSANTHRVTLTLSLPPFEGCRFDLAKGEQYGEAFTQLGGFVGTSIEDQLEAQRGDRRGVPVVTLLVFTPICTSRLSSAAAQRR
jgi:hypothetical protein